MQKTESDHDLPQNSFHIIIILEKAVGRTHIAQVLDSLDYMKKVLITNNHWQAPQRRHGLRARAL